MYIDPVGRATISFSIGVDVTLFFVGISFSIGIAFDDDSNVAIQGSFSAPAFVTAGNTTNIGLLDAGVGISIQFTDDDTVYDLEGPTSYGGFTVGNGMFIGADLVYSGANIAQNFETEKTLSGFQVSFGMGVGVDAHFRQTHTFTIFPSSNRRK